MVRKSSLMTVACFALGVLVAASTAVEAQGRRRGQRGRGGFGGFGGSTFGSLKSNKYLQQQLKMSAEQVKRMNEIDLQLQGGRALTSDEIVKALGISDSQKESIRKARESAFSDLRNSFRRGGNGQRPDFSEIRKKMAEASKKADEASMKVLTASQRKKWQTMLGAPIDKDKARTRPNFGGRRGGPGGTPRKKRPDV